MEDITTLEPEANTIDFGAETSTSATDETIDFGPTVSSPAVNPVLAQGRAEKYHYASGPLSPGEPQIKDELLSGMEDLTRQKAIDVERQALESQRQNDFLTFVKNSSKNGETLDQNDYATLSGFSGPLMHNLLTSPDTYFEKKRAQRVVQDALPEGADIPGEAKTGLENFLSNQYTFTKILEDTQARYSQETTFSKGVSIAKLFVPVYSWWTKHNAVEGAPTSSLLEGKNIQEQVQYLLSLPTDEAHIKAQAAIDEMYGRSPLDAVSFAEALVSYGEGDEATANLLNVVNVSTGVTAGTAVRAATGLLPIAKVAASRNATIPAILDASGQVARAAWQTTAQRLIHAAEGSGARPNSIADIGTQIPSISNPSSILDNAGSTPFSTEFANRLEDLLVNQSEALLSRGLNVNNIVRLEPNTQAYNAAMQEVQDLFALQYPNINNGVVSIAPIRSADNVLTNTDHIAVHIGRNNGTLFDAEYEAEAIARLNGLKGYTIQRRGENFYIEMTKAIDETTPTVRGALQIDTAINQSPNTVANRFLGWFRTKDSVLPSGINQEVKTATFGAEQFSNLSKAILERSFAVLPRWRNNSRRDFLSFLEHQRDVPSLNNPLQRGRFSSDIGDFVHDWRAYHGRDPSELETTAYFTYKQVNDAEWVVRNLNIYKGKTRLGFENFDFKVKGQNYQSTPTIEGRLKDIPFLFQHDDDAGVLVFGNHGNQDLYFRKNHMSANDRSAIEHMHDTQGYRLVQLSQFGEEELRRIHGSRMPEGRINYVLVKDYSSQPLGLNQIPYRPGGHVVYADNNFISQPVIRGVNYRGSTIHDYYGDHNLLAFRTGEQARRYTDAMNTAREMLLNGNHNGLRTFLENNRNLPFSYQDFTRMFDPARGGIFDVNTPFFARSNGRSVHQEYKLDQMYQNFRDPLNTPHNPFNEDVNLQFAMERDEQLNTIVNLGSRTAPWLNLQASRNVDPTTTLSRSIVQATKGRYYEDLKIKSAERFVQEFGDLFKGSHEELQRFPLKTLMGDALDKTNPDKGRLAAALNYRRAMREFFNVKDVELSRAESIVNSVNEFAMRALGEARGGQVANIVEPYLLHTVTDPSRFFRSVAFNLRMGFFNLKQLFLQGQGVALTAAIEGPERAARGAALSGLMRPLHLRGNDRVLDQAAAHAHTLTGIDPAHFKESYLALQRSGFQNVGGEFGTLDDVLNPRIVTSGAHKALDSSLVFFRKGERINRLTAWNASYLRWREENPVGLFDLNAQKSVLTRADLLTGNMTRASNAGFNNGLWSIPSQFFSYQARLMDLMLGGRLSPREKMRIYGTFSALYGVPLGVLGTTAGAVWPWHEQLKKEMIQGGYDPNDPWVSTFADKAFVDGIPQAMISLATGGEVDPNIAETFGPNGNSLIRDFFQNPMDKSTIELVGGPALKTATDVLSGAGKLMQASWTHLKQGYGQENEPYAYSLLATASEDAYPMTMADILPLLQNVSSVNQGVKAYYAYTLGQYMSKNGIKVIDQNAGNSWNAFLTAAFGTVPQDVSDYFQKQATVQDIKTAQADQKTEAIRYLRFSFDASLSDQDRLSYHSRAHQHMIMGGFTEAQKYEIIREAVSKGKGIDEITRIDQRLKTSDKQHIDDYIKQIMGKK